MRKALTPELYRRARSLYAAHPGNHARIVAELGISKDLAKRLWNGPAYAEPQQAALYPIPLKEVLDDETREATALRKRQLEEERLQAESDAIAKERSVMDDERGERVRQRAAEQKLLEMTRAIAGSLLNAFKDLAPAVQLLATHTRSAAEKEVLEGKLSSAESAARVKDVAIIAEKVGKMGIAVIEEGRRSRGEPTQVVEIQAAPPKGYAAALEEARQLSEAMELAGQTADLVVEGEESPSA